MWEYLSQFWEAITEVIVEAGEYTIDWFQSVGNAVAGAIGGMFEWLVHYLNDFFIFLGWIFSILKEIIQTLFLPISFVFNFLKSFTISAFSNPQTPEISYNFSSGILSVFDAIPYWNVIKSILAVSFLVVGSVIILKLFLSLT